MRSSLQRNSRISATRKIYNPSTESPYLYIPTEGIDMNRILRPLLISLAVFSCSQPADHTATDAEWRQWQSYLERAAKHPDSTFLLTDSALFFARTHGMTDTGLYRPWELKASAERYSEKIKEAKSWLDSMHAHAADAGHAAVEVRALNGIAQLMMQTPDWKMAEIPLRDALDLVEVANTNGEKPFVLLSWGGYLRRNGQAMEAIDTLNLAEQLFRAAGNRRFLGHIYQFKGEMFQDQKDTVSALSSFRTSLEDYAAIGDINYMSRSYRRIAGIMLARDPDSAIYYFRASVNSDPTHIFAYSYLSGLIQFGQYHLNAGRPENALPYIDSAVQFTTARKNPAGAWNAWLCKGVAHLQQKDTILCDSALKRAISISMDNGMFNDFTWALTQWHEKFKKQGQTASAQRLAMWADPKKFTARTDFEAVQPKQVLEIPASRRAAIQKSERLRLGLGIGSVLLILFAIWRISIRRRNNNFTLYRERAAALAAARTYRRDAIANASYHASEDGTQLVIDRERRVLAMEVLFETEQPHLNPDLTFSDVCNRLQEPEPAFRSIVKKMYDVEFETWLEEWRIDEAIKQLNAGADLSNLHTNCGFKDAASFRKTFKKVTGLKPGSYLKWPKPPIR